MKFSLSWLHTHLDTDAPLDRITDTLTAIGLELEGVEDRASALAPFRVVAVREAAPHPNADRLRVCTVDTGTETVTVVCGAPNARAGMRAVFAPVGAFVPGTGITMKAGEIRGIVSNGMLVSARELGLGDEHDGILDLPDDAPVGTPYAAFAGLDDPVIEIAVTPNRGDALSVRGVARDLAAAGLGTLRAWQPAPVPAAFGGGLRWANEFPEACPYVLGRIVRGVSNGTSPEWLAARLSSVGLRPISTLVDITNFFTLDLGRPLHVFDAERVAGGTLTLRRGAAETFAGLHGRDVTVTEDDCVIADGAGVQSLAGVVGGEATSCTPDTREVFIECALFDPVRIAQSGRRHAITSDARARFERGVDPALMADAMEAATRMIIDLCGGEAGEIVSVGAPPAWRRDATMRFVRIAGLGGADIAPDDAVAALNRLGFVTQARDAASVTVAVPSWRNDVAQKIVLDQYAGLPPERARIAAEGCAAVEAECDLIEEVLRLHGLDAIPPVSMPVADVVPSATLTQPQARRQAVRRALAAAGLQECVTFSFCAHAAAEKFGEAHASRRVENPIAADLDQMRPTPLATLAPAAARAMARRAEGASLFEVGPGFRPDGTWMAAALRTGARPRTHAEAARPLDALDAKADALAVLAALGVPEAALSVTADPPPHYHPGRAGVVRQGPKTLAYFGELHPSLCAAMDLPTPSVACEVFLDAFVASRRRRRAAPDLPALQPVRRDFAFIVADDVHADAVLRATAAADRMIADAVLFDDFRGGSVPTGKRSLGVEVTIQPVAATLTDAELDAISTKIADKVARVGGTLRSDDAP